MFYLGIDVSKDYLDLAWIDQASVRTKRMPNTPTGITDVLEQLQQQPVELVTLEATGVYHQPVVSALLLAVVPVAVLNPRHLHAFRDQQQTRNKTDREDAVLLARFGQTYAGSLRRSALPEAEHMRLRHWVAYRDGLVQERTRIRNRLEAAGWQDDPVLIEWLQADLAAAQERIRLVERAIAEVLARLPEAGVIATLIGVGPRVAAAVLGYLPPDVWGDAKAAAAYAGVHPQHIQSGRRARSHLSRQGHRRLRRYLYTAARVAVQRNPEMEAFYLHLVAAGKAPKAAMCAVMHKLLRQMMGELRAYYRAQTALVA